MDHDRNWTYSSYVDKIKEPWLNSSSRIKIGVANYTKTFYVIFSKQEFSKSNI